MCSCQTKIQISEIDEVHSYTLIIESFKTLLLLVNLICSLSFMFFYSL